MEIIATDLVRSLVYLSLAEINLVFQIVILAVLSASVITLRKGRHHFLHGSTMLIATLLNALSFIWVMGPSLLNLGRLVVDKPYTMISTVTVAHGILGAIAGILACSMDHCSLAFTLVNPILCRKKENNENHFGPVDDSIIFGNPTLCFPIHNLVRVSGLVINTNGIIIPKNRKRKEGKAASRG